jgi:hypothetical protein
MNISDKELLEILVARICSGAIKLDSIYGSGISDIAINDIRENIITLYWTAS